MYYATELFIKKGTLGKIWIAGTIFKKLTKKAILESDIQELCQQVLEPPVPLAISTCGRLTLGIVRIHDKIIHYLLTDAADAQAKLRTIVVKSAINLPVDQLRARPEQITIHRVEDVAGLADVDLTQADFLERTLPIDKRGAEALLARPEEITLEEETMQLEEERREIGMDFGLDMVGREEPLIEFDLPLSPGVASIKRGDIEPLDLQDFSLALPDTTIPSVPQFSATPTIVEAQPPLPYDLQIEEQPVITEEIIPIQRPQPRKEIKRRFPRDTVIEYKDEERLIEDEKWNQHLIERPEFIALGERPLEDDGFQRLLTTSLSGLIPQDSELANAYSRFSKYMIDPDSAQHYISDEIKTAIEQQELPEQYEPFVPAEVGREEEITTVPSTPGPSVIFKPQPGTGDVSIPSRFDQMSVETGRKAPSELRDRFSETEISQIQPENAAISSEELTAPSELSHLSEIFRELIQQKFNRMGRQKAGTKIDFEELLNEAALSNNAKLNRHDIALGFLQALILKNEDIIDMSQKEFYQPLQIAKGLRFDNNIH